MEYKAITISKCPCCGSEVDWMTSRDVNIGQAYMECTNGDCILSINELPFYFTYMVFEGFEDKYDLIKTMCLRWNEWCATNPTRYNETSWSK